MQPMLLFKESFKTANYLNTVKTRSLTHTVCKVQGYYAQPTMFFKMFTQLTVKLVILWWCFEVFCQKINKLLLVGGKDESVLLMLFSLSFYHSNKSSHDVTLQLFLIILIWPSRVFCVKEAWFKQLVAKTIL